MTRKELVAAVAKRTGLPRRNAASAVDATFATITETLKGGDFVKISGFGVFRVRHRQAGEGRDPRTGETVKIEASNRPRFTSGKLLRQALNS
jgi:DNA-binding protein HU-beta